LDIWLHHNYLPNILLSSTYYTKTYLIGQTVENAELLVTSFNI